MATNRIAKYFDCLDDRDRLDVAITQTVDPPVFRCQCGKTEALGPFECDGFYLCRWCVKDRMFTPKQDEYIFHVHDEDALRAARGVILFVILATAFVMAGLFIGCVQ